MANWCFNIAVCHFPAPLPRLWQGLPNEPALEDSSFRMCEVPHLRQMAWPASCRQMQEQQALPSVWPLVPRGPQVQRQEAVERQADLVCLLSKGDHWGSHVQPHEEHPRDGLVQGRLPWVHPTGNKHSNNISLFTLPSVCGFPIA